MKSFGPKDDNEGDNKGFADFKGTKRCNDIHGIYGWMKAVAGFRRSRFRGRPKTAFAGTTAAATYNLLRITKLQPAT